MVEGGIEPDTLEADAWRAELTVVVHGQDLCCGLELVGFLLVHGSLRVR